MSWLGKRKESQEEAINNTIYHMPPNLSVRLGDMTEGQLRSSLHMLISHIKSGGVIRMQPGDKHQKIILDREWFT